MKIDHFPPNGRKPGRPRDPALEELRAVLLPQRSERTRARFKAAVELLRALGMSPDQVGQAIAEAHRPNGSLNVNLLVWYANWLARKATDEVVNGDELSDEAPAACRSEEP